VWDKHVLSCLGGYQLRELTPAIVAQWRTDRHDSGAGDSVLRSAMIVLQGMLKYAVQEGKTSTNVVRVVDKPRQEQPDWPEPVPPLIVEKIRATLQPRDAMLVSLLAYAGLRPQEALAVRWEHWNRSKLRVYAPKTRRTRVIDLIVTQRVAGRPRHRHPACRSTTLAGATGAPASGRTRPSSSSRATCGPTGCAAALPAC
jgi:integrase